MTTIAQEIEQAKAELAACEQALNHADDAFVTVAVLRLSAARERLNVLYGMAKEVVTA